MKEMNGRIHGMKAIGSMIRTGMKAIGPMKICTTWMHRYFQKKGKAKGKKGNKGKG